jgi:hypothetical protein
VPRRVGRYLVRPPGPLFLAPQHKGRWRPPPCGGWAQGQPPRDKHNAHCDLATGLARPQSGTLPSARCVCHYSEGTA